MEHLPCPSHRAKFNRNCECRRFHGLRGQVTKFTLRGHGWHCSGWMCPRKVLDGRTVAGLYDQVEGRVGTSVWLAMTAPVGAQLTDREKCYYFFLRFLPQMR